MMYVHLRKEHGAFFGTVPKVRQALIEQKIIPDGLEHHVEVLSLIGGKYAVRVNGATPEKLYEALRTKDPITKADYWSFSEKK